MLILEPRQMLAPKYGAGIGDIFKNIASKGKDLIKGSVKTIGKEIANKGKDLVGSTVNKLKPIGRKVLESGIAIGKDIVEQNKDKVIKAATDMVKERGNQLVSDIARGKNPGNVIKSFGNNLLHDSKAIASDVGRNVRGTVSTKGRDLVSKTASDLRPVVRDAVSGAKSIASDAKNKTSKNVGAFTDDIGVSLSSLLRGTGSKRSKDAKLIKALNEYAVFNETGSGLTLPGTSGNGLYLPGTHPQSGRGMIYI